MSSSSSLPASSQPNHGIQFGKYNLVERLGRGGMAEVWKARITGPAGFARTLVIKRILPHLVEDPQFVEMFMAEARLSARLNHANIVQVYELGDVDGEFFLAMEYVRGRDLVSAVRAQILRGLPAPGFGAFVVRDICRALGYAHALADEDGRPLRLIHRDVSPSNIMLSFDGAVKLLDFGIAKALADASANKTQTGTLKGKFGYMAPEQVEGRDVDHRADLFSAGVVLHEVLTGRRLFKGASDLQTLAMVRDAKVEPPSLLNEQVPAELDAVCLKALSRLPEDRYQTGEEFAQALDEVALQLKWGPERLTSMLKDLFPDEPSTSTSQRSIMPPDSRPKSNLTVGALRRYERRRNIAVMAAAFLLVFATTWIVASKRTANQQRRHQREQLAELPSAPPTEPSATDPPPAREIMVRISSEPPGADVFIEGEVGPRGRTPLTLYMPKQNGFRRLTLNAKGYEPATTQVATDIDTQVSLGLTRAAVPPPTPRPRRVDSTPKTSKPKQTVDLRKGDVVDPFSK